jgi:hypothetical protein
MKKTLLLHLLALICGITNAQEPFRNLVITEASLGYGPMAYVELTNKGDKAINLSEFELGKVTHSTTRKGYVPGNPCPPLENWFNVPENDRMMLPDVELAPGKSWVMANVSDWRLAMEKIDPFLYRQRYSQVDMYELADYHMHYPEHPGTPPAKDSADLKYRVLDVSGGSDVIYIRHHYINSSGQKVSAVIDQVGGVFDDIDCTNRDAAYSVAGIFPATKTHLLLRSAPVKEGNIDFFNGRGVSMEDSEWMPVLRYTARHPVQWHTGNHGAFELDENTLRPRAGSGVTVDWDNAVINVPWGVQRDDSLVYRFEKTHGMGWQYRYVPDENSRWNQQGDSAFLSARSGDTLRVYVAGNTLQWEDFRIIVAEPAAGDNMIIPKRSPDYKTGWFGKESAYTDNARFRVTGGSQVDTIKHSYNIPGIDFATRVDSLFKYLEKAPGASWEIIWVDGQKRADLKHGDILRVTAENGAIKDYFIRVHDYRPGNNAFLGAIAWPDIPSWYRGMMGWKGDTIPGFSPGIYSYNVLIPADVDGFPALVGRPQDPNSRVYVTRASGINGTPEKRTVTFTVTAEDGSTERVYTVTVEKEKFPHQIQPYRAEPIISEFIFWEQWNNGFVEIANTGTVQLDLSKYMFANRVSQGPETIFETELAHHNRYQLYIPGYKWTASPGDWEFQPLMAEPDLYINPVLAPGDVFTMGEIRSWSFARDYENWFGATWWVPGVLDINFGYSTDNGMPSGPNRVAQNPWGENIVNPANDSWGESAARQWSNSDFYIFKILNDSVRFGLKPANDPADFKVIEIFGTGDETLYNPAHHQSGSAPMITSFVRKPQNVVPRPEPKGSFGKTMDETEWSYTDESYWHTQNVGWPQQILNIALDLGRHTFIPPTHYKSTVTSSVYLVSPGYLDEEIRGIVTGTTADQFLGKIDKMDPGQSLWLISGNDTLQGNDVIRDADILRVVSADELNITDYVLIVKPEGLMSDALLTSDQFVIEVTGESGTIRGFEYGSTLRSIRNGVTVPKEATLTIVDEQDRYMSLQQLNYDHYVDVLVTDKIFFEVVAENGETKILYRLVPDSTPGDVYVYSDVYWVDQRLHLVRLVPPGTSVAGLIGNLTPSAGATVKVVDKYLMERQQGTLAKDDKILVVSADQQYSRIYFISLVGDDSYYAWLASNIYDVDQSVKKITVKREEGNPLVYYELLDGVSIPDFATLDVTDEHGHNKSGSNVVETGDIIIVTSGDGLTVTDYIVEVKYLSAYTLTYAASGDGTLLGESNQRVLHGLHGKAVSVMPDYGFKFAGWSDGETTNPRTDFYVTGNITVEAEFEISTYTLSYSSGENGKVEGSLSQIVTHGTDGTAVEAIPDEGYHFVRWSDGITDNPRTDINVTRPLVVRSVFAINLYSLTYSAGPNGAISGETQQMVEYGSDGSAVEAIAATGYHFVSWCDGCTINPRTDENLTGDNSFTAEFAINIYLVKATEYPAGAGTISGQDEYEHGQAITLTAIPAAGYLFEKWTEDGDDFTGSTENPLVFPADRNIDLVANFVVDQSMGIDPAGRQGIRIWPNPADDVLYIEGLTGRTTMHIHDLHGTLVGSMDPVNNQIRIDDLPPGIYIIKLITGNEVVVHRLIKQ